MAATPLKKLDCAEQNKWLLQHIPHRICAALTWLPMEKMSPHPEWKDKEKDKFHIWCICRSVDEGRKAAMRWLIEFVGIKTDAKKNPVRPDRRPTDVWIEHFHPGTGFNLTDPNAKKLADVWQGCSQASMHATANTDHPAVGVQELAEALQIVVEYLEKNLYAPNGFILCEIVRDQEEKKHLIWR